MKGALGPSALPYTSLLPSSLPRLEEVYWQAPGGPKMPQAQGLPPSCPRMLIPASQACLAQLLFWTACLFLTNILTVWEINSTLHLISETATISFFTATPLPLLHV